MSLPDDTPLSRRLPGLLDLWFAPRWRALLTWVLLAGVSKAMWDMVGDKYGFGLILRAMELMDRVLPMRWASTVPTAALVGNSYLAMHWFEPIALRLDLRRCVMWLGVCIAPAIAHLGPASIFGQWFAVISGFLVSVATIPILSGCRSRPWMAVAGWVLARVVWAGIRAMASNPPGWFVYASLAFAYAIPMLYGTRLLRPEERERA